MNFVTWPDLKACPQRELRGLIFAIFRAFEGEKKSLRNLGERMSRRFKAEKEIRSLERGRYYFVAEKTKGS